MNTSQRQSRENSMPHQFQESSLHQTDMEFPHTYPLELLAVARMQLLAQPAKADVAVTTSEHSLDPCMHLPLDCSGPGHNWNR